MMAVADHRGRGGGSLWPLVEALARVPYLGSVENRNFMVRLLNDEFGTLLPVREHSLAVQHLFNIAEICQMQPSGFRVLHDVLYRLDRGSTAFSDVRRIIGELADRDNLFALLGGLHPAELGEIYRAVAGPSAPQLPEDPMCRDVFVILERLNAGTDGLPRSLAFIERLAAAFGGDLAVELRDWADRQAARMDLVTELLAVRRQAITPLPAPPVRHAPAYLVFLLHREGPAGSDFRLSSWQQLDVSKGWYPERVSDVTGGLDEMRRHVASMIEAAEGEWADYQPDIRLEFILSGELLNLDVDQWPWETDSPLPVPIGCRYSVVVRDLQRMRTKKWHRPWLSRWQALTAQLDDGGALAADSGYWSSSSDQHGLRQIIAAFEYGSQLLALVLSAPPQRKSEGGDEIGMALRAGVPLILWDRDDCSSDGFVAMARDLLHGESPGGLLDRVKAARVNAFAEGSAARHAGGRLSLLWDDPHRLVVPPQPVLPEAVVS